MYIDEKTLLDNERERDVIVKIVGLKLNKNKQIAKEANMSTDSTSVSNLILRRDPAREIDWDKVAEIQESIREEGYRDYSVINVIHETSTGYYYISNGNHRAIAASREGIQTVSICVISTVEVYKEEQYGQP